jgi:Zn-dependent protease/CBS domain-containing protein
MESSVTLVRVWGIPIGFHWSWFIVVGLVTMSLGAGYLPEEYPALPTPGVWVLAALTAILMFVSVVLHELGHSWVALRNDITVKQITLFIFGGIARIAREPATAGAEFRIAIGGPIVSLALSASFFAVYLAGRGTDWIEAPAQWLASINLLLFLFNLIPGYPLDGGRVLYAAVWQFTNDKERASRIAGISGHVAALGLIGVGAALALTGDVGNGLWLMLIGWFLQFAVTATEQQTGLQRELRGVTVDQIMHRGVTTIPSTATLHTVIDTEVLRHGERLFVVVDDGRPRGLLTLHDITRVPRDQWDTMTASVAMEPWGSLVILEPGTELLAAMQSMADAEIAQAPVASNGSVLGTLSREEIARYLRLRSEVHRLEGRGA